MELNLRKGVEIENSELPIQAMQVYMPDLPKYDGTIYTRKQLRDFTSWYMKNVQYPALASDIVKYVDDNNLRISRFKYYKLNTNKMGILLGQDPRYRKISEHKGGKTYNWWYFASDYKSIKPTPVYDGFIKWKKHYGDFADWYMRNIEYPAKTDKMIQYAKEWGLFVGGMAIKKQSGRTMAYALRNDTNKRFVGRKVYDEETQKSEYRWFFKHETPIYGRILDLKIQ